jgi:outer membrane protein
MGAEKVGAQPRRQPLVMLRRALFTLSLITAVSAVLAAEPTPPPLPAGVDLSKPVTLSQCVALALAVNPQVTISQQGIVRSDAGTVQAQSAQLPAVDLNWSVTVGKSLGASSLGGGRSTQRTADVTLSQIFYQAGLRERIGIARAGARASRFAYQDTRRSVILNVVQSYYTVLAAQSLADVAGRSLASSEQHLTAAQTRIEAGTTAASDRYPFDVEVAQARLAVISADDQVKVSLVALKQAIGLPGDSPLTVSDSLARPAPPTGLDELLEAAYRDRPDVLEQQSQVDSAQLSVRIAQIARGPVLSASGSATEGRFTGTTGNTWSLQAGLTMPVFDGGYTRAGVDSARASLTSATEALRQVRLGVSSDVERSFIQATEANARIDVTEVAVKAAQTSLDAAQGKYQEGAAGTSVIDVTDAQLRLTQAESDRIKAYYDYNSALAALQAAIGQPAVPIEG